MSATDTPTATAPGSKPYEDIRKAWKDANLSPLWESQIAHKARDAGQPIAVAPMHRDDHGIHTPAARDVQRLTKGVGMQGVEAAVTHRVDARAFRRRENRAYRDHAHHGTAGGSTVGHRDCIPWGRTAVIFRTEPDQKNALNKEGRLLVNGGAGCEATRAHRRAPFDLKTPARRTIIAGRHAHHRGCSQLRALRATAQA